MLARSLWRWQSLMNVLKIKWFLIIYLSLKTWIIFCYIFFLFKKRNQNFTFKNKRDFILFLFFSTKLGLRHCTCFDVKVNLFSKLPNTPTKKIKQYSHIWLPLEVHSYTNILLQIKFPQKQEWITRFKR